MREAAAIVEPAIDECTRAILREFVELQDCDRRLETTEKQAHSVMRKADGLRQEQARRRVEIGRLLIEAKRGIKHGGWLPYLEKLGIDKSSASNWMKLAGHVEAQIPNSDTDVRNLPSAPTLADAGIDRRPRKRDEQPDLPVAPQQIIAAPSIDIDRELSRMSEKIRAFAESVPADARLLIAQQLRLTAELIEQMKGG